MKGRLPVWLTQRPPELQVMSTMRTLLEGLNVHTICESAVCPNIGECSSRRTAAFLILGDVCTRHCTFCAVKKGKPRAPDPQEPEHIVAAVDKLGLKYVVITSVTRDDLPDGGAQHFARTIEALYNYNGKIKVEVLVPDFKGSKSALETVLEASPAVFNHNVETVPRLYQEVRPEADYYRSLELLRNAASGVQRLLTKSGIMLGLGENQQEVIDVMVSLRKVGCRILTIGQYLSPSPKHHKIVRFVTPEEFAEYTNIGRELGFASVVSGPFVRSSFFAAETYLSASGGNDTLVI